MIVGCCERTGMDAGGAILDDVGVYDVEDRSDVRRWGVLFRTFLLRTCALREGEPVEECSELSNLGIMKLGSVCSDCVMAWACLEGRGVRSLADDLGLWAVTSSKTG